MTGRRGEPQYGTGPGGAVSAGGRHPAAAASQPAETRRRPESGNSLPNYLDLAASVEPTRLDLPETLPLPTWCEIGNQILRLADSSSWWIGDWLVFGQERYRDRYKRAMAETLLDYQTLRNYAWVARRFEPSRRRARLTFQHHMEVAALPVDEQEHWLDFALRMNWSRNELRKQVRASVADSNEPDVAKVRLQLQISPERMERWEAEAARHNCSLSDWMARVLDRAVQGSLSSASTA
ncbi:LmbU family transcriptional regulator [Micromonospora sp. NPDC049051]|uniref:LmbU family transcriptional regulator n=1 Tax=unclassified Micromonospora TaxID=2617518 RepID=UPI003713C7F4